MQADPVHPSALAQIDGDADVAVHAYPARVHRIVRVAYPAVEQLMAAAVGIAGRRRHAVVIGGLHRIDDVRGTQPVQPAIGVHHPRRSPYLAGANHFGHVVLVEPGNALASRTRAPQLLVDAAPTPTGMHRTGRYRYQGTAGCHG